MADCTFATYCDLPELDPDDRLVLDILENRGFDCQGAVWDSPDVDWASAGVTVLRSTWDYHRKFDQFMNWVEETSQVTELFNRPPYIRWNAHKGYIRELSESGIAVVPTQWLLKGWGAAADSIAPQLQELLRQNAGKVVVKPAIGLATSGVLVVESGNFDEGVGHVEKLLESNDVMVQPFISSVKQHGEKSLVFINGRYCHAAQKAAFQALAMAGGAGEQPAVATVDELDLAERAMTAVSELVRRASFAGQGVEDAPYPVPPLYARIDIVRGDNGEPMIIELELVEPTLFLGFYPQSAEFFADAIGHLIERSRQTIADRGMFNPT